jgi:3-oxoadipate enol-lactonase
MPILNMANGPDINYVRTRATGGVPIVFIHALGLDLSIWEHQFEAFGGDHDLLAMDLPGHGRSGDLQQPPNFRAMAQSVCDLLEHLHIAQAHLVGISVGGMIAQTLAVMAPQRIRSLILVATSCTFPDAVRTILRERAQLVRAGGMKAVIPLHLDRWFPQAFRQKRPDVLDRLSKILLRQDREFHAGMWDMVAELELHQDLGSLGCPAMVVAGALDMSASPEAGNVIVHQLPGAKLHVMPGSGHFPQMEFPVEFNRLMRAFLQQTE